MLTLRQETHTELSFPTIVKDIHDYYDGQIQDLNRLLDELQAEVDRIRAVADTTANS